MKQLLFWISLFAFSFTQAQHIPFTTNNLTALHTSNIGADLLKTTKEPVNEGGTKFVIGVAGTANYTQWFNSSDDNNPGIYKAGQNASAYGINCMLFFTPRIGLAFGLEYSTYRDRVTLRYPFELTPHLIITHGTVELNRSASYVELPFLVKLFDGNFKRISPYLHLGFSPAVITDISLKYQGTFGSSISAADYYSSPRQYEGLNRWMIFGQFGAGISVPVSKRIKINFGVNGKYGFLPMFMKSENPYGYTMPVGENGPTRPISIGAQLGLSFNPSGR
jgi:hypothetical protein